MIAVIVLFENGFQMLTVFILISNEFAVAMENGRRETFFDGAYDLEN